MPTIKTYQFEFPSGELFPKQPTHAVDLPDAWQPILLDQGVWDSTRRGHFFNIYDVNQNVYVGRIWEFTS